ncbi:MAG: uroporphyrinogen decarboxylase family protein [Bryobacteraceae bacterium]
MPDRVPIQFDLCRSLLDTFGARYGIPVHYTNAWFDDLTYRISGNELRVAMGSDCVVAGIGMPRGYEHRKDSDGNIINEFGMKLRQGPLYVELIESPLRNVTSVADVESFGFPDPLAEGRYDDAARYIARYGKQYFVIGDIEITIFAMMRHLVGMEKLLMDMAAGEPYIEALRDKVEAFAIAAGRRLVAMGVDGIWAGDDFGTQRGLLLSPAMFRRYFKEPYRRLYSGLKALNPSVLIMQHSDGTVAPILDDWIEAGMEVFNPVQPGVPGHEPEELKRRFGDRLGFWGGVDQQRLLPAGSPQEIDQEVRRVIGILGRGGGYMVAPSHILQPDTPVENVQAFLDAARKYGEYTN